MERFLGYTEGRQSHIKPCKNPGCPNKIKNSSDLGVCQSCSEKWSDNFKKIYKLEDAIARKKEELRKLEEALHIEKIELKYEVDLVSDDVRVHEGFSSDHGLPIPIKLETHCTIVRVKDSPENVYFGHVTLVISNNFGTKYKWHYGAEVVNKKIPKDLKHVFWYYDNKQFSPETTNVNYFADFPTIPDNTTLAEIMKYHFKKCVTFFKTKTQWPNQVWYPNDKIKINSEIEIATDLVDRLIQMKNERKKIDYATFATGQREERKAERKAVKEIKRQEKQEKQEQAKKAVELAIQQELARKADQPTQEPNYMSEEIRTEAERQEKDRRAREVEQNEKNRQLELIRKDKIESEKLAEQQEKERQEKLNFETQTKKNPTLVSKKSIEREKKRKALEALEAKRIAELETKHADEKALEEALAEALAEKSKKAQEKKESEQRSTSILHDKAKTRLEIQVKNKVKYFLEEIKEQQKDINNMEKQLEKEKDPISDNSFNLRYELYDRYNSLLEHIKNTMIDLENEINTYLKDPDKMNILQKISEQKKDLEARLALILKKYITFLLFDWKQYYSQIIVPIEERLRTFDPDQKDASETRRSLIEYYRDEYKVNSLELTLETLSEEDSNNISREIINLNELVKSEERLKDLYKVEAGYLIRVYATQDDNFNESDEDIIENFRILKPEFNTNYVEQIVKKAKEKSADKGKQFFSTKTMLLMYPKLFK
jgi:hypothetical protein